MTNKDLKERTFSFALRILKLGKSTQWGDVDRILIRQLMRSATSVGANYRAALRAKSKRDFLYKINIVEEEADECYFWLELIAKAEILQEKKLQLLLNEANELTAIFTAQGRTTKLALAKSKQTSI